MLLLHYENRTNHCRLYENIYALLSWPLTSLGRDISQINSLFEWVLPLLILGGSQQAGPSIVPFPERSSFSCLRTGGEMAESHVSHEVPLRGPQPAETKVLLMKNIGVVVIGTILLVTSLAVSVGSMVGQVGSRASFCCSPPPVCSPERPCITGVGASFGGDPPPVCSPLWPCIPGSQL
jgi:hypothetical protein